ncbi:MAG: DUF3828 domain-containing protein [Caulobacter sp.]|nr:DUF3828 domain-containing protein [Caulobacter sp.]
MRLLTLAVLLLLAPVTARAQSLDDAPPVYVASVYDRLAKGEAFEAPDALYTPRLLALWKDMEQDAGGEVGRLDANYWTNSQDWTISDVTIASAYVDGHDDDRMIVVARFRDMDRNEAIQFYFEKLGGQWKLDDVASLGEAPWTLSLALKYGLAGGI